MEIEEAEVVEAEEEAEEEEEEVVAAVITKISAVISAKIWIINNRNILDIESVIQIIGTQEIIREVVAVDTEEILAEIIVRIIIKITVKVTARIINSRSTPVKEILMEVIIGIVVIIIKTGERAEEEEEEEVAEFKVDGIKVVIIPA